MNHAGMAGQCANCHSGGFARDLIDRPGRKPGPHAIRSLTELLERAGG